MSLEGPLVRDVSGVCHVGAGGHLPFPKSCHVLNRSSLWPTRCECAGDLAQSLKARPGPWPTLPQLPAAPCFKGKELTLSHRTWAPGDTSCHSSLTVADAAGLLAFPHGVRSGTCGRPAVRECRWTRGPVLASLLAQR